MNRSDWVKAGWEARKKSMQEKFRERVRGIEEDEGDEIMIVLRDYAEMGYSRAFVARMWCFTPANFRQRFLPRLDPGKTIPWRPAHECVDFSETKGDGQRGKKRSRRCRKYPVGDLMLSAIEIAKKSGCDVKTIYNRYSKGVRGEALLRRPMSKGEASRCRKSRKWRGMSVSV